MAEYAIFSSGSPLVLHNYAIEVPIMKFKHYSLRMGSNGILDPFNLVKQDVRT